MLTLTGQPATARFIQETLQIRYGVNIPVTRDLDLGETASYNCGSSNITVYVQPAPENKTDMLLLSNEPEDIYGEGILFRKILKSGFKVRIVYYHRSKSLEPIYFRMELAGKEKQILHCLQATGGPSRDGIAAGHQATKRYLEKCQKEEGEYLIMPPSDEMTLLEQKLLPEQIASGYVELNNLSKNDAEIIFYATRQTDQIPWYRIHPPQQDKQISGIFFNPQQNILASIEVSEDMVQSFRIGDEPFLVDFVTGRTLKGNYGLLYKYQLTFINTTARPAQLKVYAAGHGGSARATFLIDGKLRETGLLAATNKVQELDTIIIDDKREVEIVTIPQPGSNYPVGLIFKSKGDLSSEY